MKSFSHKEHKEIITFPTFRTFLLSHTTRTFSLWALVFNSHYFSEMPHPLMQQKSMVL